MESVEEDEGGSAKDSQKHRLNALVAITVALLATFMGLCRVKADNVAQGMQQAQADKINYYAWYQARNLREEMGRTAVAQLRAQRAAAPPAALAEFDKQIAACETLEREQNQKKNEQQEQAQAAEKKYDTLGVRDDQFDLTDALLTLAVAMLAMTALTQKRWLYFAALVPIVLGAWFGIAGLLGWQGEMFHPTALTRFLS